MTRTATARLEAGRGILNAAATLGQYTNTIAANGLHPLEHPGGARKR